jgi:uncharacterized membrane protein
MKMRFLWWTMLVLAASLAATFLVWQQLPERIPAHWNLAGAIDRYGPRAWLFAQPAVMLCVAGLWIVLPGVSPERFRVDSFGDTWWFSGMALVALLAYSHGVLLWDAWHGTLAMAPSHPLRLVGGIGIFLLLVGNVLGKVRRNFWLGVRTPWTLADERVWYATHRLAAKTMVASGLLMVAVAAAGLPAWLGIALLLAGTLVPAAWSLLYYKRLQRSGGLGA